MNSTKTGEMKIKSLLYIPTLKYLYKNVFLYRKIIQNGGSVVTTVRALFLGMLYEQKQNFFGSTFRIKRKKNIFFYHYLY